MNTIEKRSETRKLLNPAFHFKDNVIKINEHNTFAHELAKFLLSHEAISEGKKIITEAVFENGKRADILILDDHEVWEVLQSETKERFNEKKEAYPCNVIPFYAEDVIEHYRDKIHNLLKKRPKK